jgi:phage-related protein
MIAKPPKWPAVLYRTAAGREVVRDWFRSLDDVDRKTVGEDLMRVQFQWPVGMPLCRPLGQGLWEVRVNLPGNRIARLLFVIKSSGILVVHAFIKKTRATPAADLALARRRADEYED